LRHLSRIQLAERTKDEGYGSTATVSVVTQVLNKPMVGSLGSRRESDQEILQIFAEVLEHILFTFASVKTASHHIEMEMESEERE
jgi:hypothetical protein